MVIKLLQKREIDKARAGDKKRETDEGKKLAQRVDDLRQLSATEEKNLRNFRDNAVKTVMEEIKGLVARKETLGEELDQLRERRKNLQIPLDAEWHKLAQDKVFLEERKENLYHKQSVLEQSEAEYEAKAKELDIETQRIDDERLRSKQTLAESVTIHTEARETLDSARNEAQAMVSRAKLKMKVTLEREQVVSRREDEVNAQLTHIEEEKIGIMNRERALTDKYATLEKTLKRIHDRRL